MREFFIVINHKSMTVPQAAEKKTQYRHDKR